MGGEVKCEKKNRKMKMLIFAALSAVVILAAAFAAMHVINQSEASAASGDTAESGESMASGNSAASRDAATSGNSAASGSSRQSSLKPVLVDCSDQNSVALYDRKVSDVNDTASVVKLLDAMKLEAFAGKYSVKITGTGENCKLFIEMKNPVKKSDQETFNNNMEIYAQQMLALIVEINEVEWSCPAEAEGSPEDSVTGAVDVAAATQALGMDVKKFGASSAEVHKLLLMQAGN